MPSNRRQFLWGAPAGLFAFSRLAELSQAQAQSGKGGALAEDVVSFWANHMGVPPEMLLGGEQAVNGSRGTEVSVGNYGREPLFLHMDEDEKTLIAAEELPKQKLMATGDAQVDFNLQRLRLSSSDKVQFQKYTSGGIYFDFQQQSTPSSDMLTVMASSVFSAIFPTGIGAGGASAPGASGSGGKGSSKSSPASATGSSKSSSGKPGKITADLAASVPLQKSTESQSIALASGAGKTAFSCFVKGRKSAFGSFLGAFQQLTDPSLPYMPLISIPLLAAPALTGIRALVGNLQAHGGDQQWLLQGSQIDLAATGDALANAPQALRLRSGSYIVVPKSHAAALKNNLDKLKIIDGFLVPKEASRFDVYDTASSVIPELTYLSLNVSVKRARTQACLIPSKG